MTIEKRAYNGDYEGDHLNRTAFPLGGIGAGMVCLEGCGALSHVSLRHRPEVYNEPGFFAALCVKGAPNVARVLEGPVPGWKVMFPWGQDLNSNSGNGAAGKTFGLPRMADASFRPHFPFATVELHETSMQVDVAVTGWSPFVPGEADESSLPMAGLEYVFTNRSATAVETVFSFHAQNVLRWGAWRQATPAPLYRTRPLPGGFALEQDGSTEHPHAQGALAIVCDSPETLVNCAWFRSGWFDAMTVVWESVEKGAVLSGTPCPDDDPSTGGSLYVPLALEPGQSHTIRLRLSWYVPVSDLRFGRGLEDADTPSSTTCTGSCRETSSSMPTHRPWYATKFESIDAVERYWRLSYDRLRQASQCFSDCFYDSTLPDEVVEAVAANLTILKSPTVLRQADGCLWAWEGCCDGRGCCEGSCTHVWNYAQALPHLFPELERSLRWTEFHENQDKTGHQNFRACLPIRDNTHNGHAAADGQLGGILKVFREWQISGDTAWLRSLWPQVRHSLEFCIENWDPEHEGALREPHHNTYDIEFWGPDGMCGSFYAGALRAAVLMGEALGEDVGAFRELLDKARHFIKSELFDGEYFIQKVQWKGLRKADPGELGQKYSPEARALLELEGPKYQYGIGCLSDGVLGSWMAEVCGVGDALDPGQVRSHLQAVFRHNFREDLSQHANPQRPTYALGHEAGLLLCSWPKGGALTLPFVYSNEVWTGIEYQVAAHLMMVGCVEEALCIVRAVRDRYDGRVRNPFNEYECGHWYARAMASYAMLQGLTGFRYSAVDQTLYLAPRLTSRPLRSFFATAAAFGTVEITPTSVRVKVARGILAIRQLQLEGRGPISCDANTSAGQTLEISY